MKKLLLHKLVVLALPIILITGCMEDDLVLKDPQKFSRPLNLAAPIGDLKLSAKDLLEQLDSISVFYVDDEGLMHLRIDTSFSAEWDDLLKLGDLSIERSYDINPAKKATNFSFSDTIVANLFSFGEDNQRFDYMTLESATLSVSVNIPNDFNGSYSIVFPEVLTAAGQPAKFERDFNDIAPMQPIDLAGGRIDFINENGKSLFRINTEVEVTSVTGIPVETEMTFSVEMLNLVPAEVVGYFGKINVFDLKQEQEFSFFETFEFTDLVQFKDMYMEVTINNYFGVPLALIIDSLLFENTKTGQSESVALAGTNNTISIDPATMGNPVIPAINSLIIDPTNSNLLDGINLGPNRVYVEIRGMVNPEGETAETNFINASTKIEGNALIDIPFWFKTSLYERSDEISFDFPGLFSDSAQVSMVEEVNLNLMFKNGFPFNIQAQIYMAKENGTIIDSLFDAAGQDNGAYIWESGVIDANGKVTAPGSTEVVLKLTNEKARLLYQENAKKIIIKSRVSTGDKENPEFVKLFESYTLEAKINFEVKSGALSY